jgi:hypothetical protein
VQAKFGNVGLVVLSSTITEVLRSDVEDASELADEAGLELLAEPIRHGLQLTAALFLDGPHLTAGQLSHGLPLTA